MLGQWCLAHGDSKQPDIMSDADDEVTRDLKGFLLKMLSYRPENRPKIREVHGYLLKIKKSTGVFAKNLIS